MAEQRGPTWQELLGRAKEIAGRDEMGWPLHSVVEAWLEQAHAELELDAEKKRTARLHAGGKPHGL